MDPPDAAPERDAWAALGSLGSIGLAPFGRPDVSAVAPADRVANRPSGPRGGVDFGVAVDDGVAPGLAGVRPEVSRAPSGGLGRPVVDSDFVGRIRRWCGVADGMDVGESNSVGSGVGVTYSIIT